MKKQSENLRIFYSKFVCASIKDSNSRIQRAFQTVEREIFAGPGPWLISVAGGYLPTPDENPAFLYHDTLIALDSSRRINIGQPSAHAFWLGALALKEGEHVIQVGAGSGYYTAIIAHLVGKDGIVHAFEIDETLAARARTNLLELHQVEVRSQSGIATDLPKVDAVYVCAGITQPSWAWIEALKPGGRLLFPLQPQGSMGGMLLIERPESGVRWPARIVSRAFFIGCIGQQDDEAGTRMKEAFAGKWNEVKSFRSDVIDKNTCWYAADDWWLSTAEPDTRPAALL